MTIQEAIQSGLPFKRKDWSPRAFLTAEKHRYIIYDDGTKEISWFTKADILADDWMVKP